MYRGQKVSSPLSYPNGRAHLPVRLLFVRTLSVYRMKVLPSRKLYIFRQRGIYIQKPATENAHEIILPFENLSGRLRWRLLFLLTHSGLVLFYAGKGLSAWAASVVPVLLPFIILSKFWICYDIPSLLFRAAEKFVPGKQYAALSAALFLLGLSSGFPIGAVFVRHFYQQHIFDKKTAEILLPSVLL